MNLFDLISKGKNKFVLDYTSEELELTKQIIEHETQTAPKQHADNGTWIRANVLVYMKKAMPDKTTRYCALLLEIVLQKVMK